MLKYKTTAVARGTKVDDSDLTINLWSVGCDKKLWIYVYILVCREKKLLQIRTADKNGKNCSTSTLPAPLQIKCPFPNKVA